MRMDLVAGIPEPGAASSNSNRHGLRRLVTVAMLGVLLLAIILFFTRSSKPDPPITWLSPTELARFTQPGPLTRLKDKLMNLTAPLWRRYWRTQPQILVDSRLMIRSAAAADQIDLGVPVATNTDGMRAWILSPPELSSFLRCRQSGSNRVFMASAKW